MDPVTVALAVFGGSALLAVASRFVERSRDLPRRARRIEQLKRHQLSVVDDAGACYLDISGKNRSLMARVGSNCIEVRATVAVLVGGVETLWVRPTPRMDPNVQDFARLRDDVAFGGVPLGNVAALLDDAVVRSAVLAIVDTGGRLAVEDHELIAVLPDRGNDEAAMRAAFDLVGPAVSALTSSALSSSSSLPETSVSSSGSPFAVRGIDT